MSKITNGPPSAEEIGELEGAAQRIIEYWRQRGITDPEQCQSRNLDELIVARLLPRLLSSLKEMRGNALEEAALLVQFRYSNHILARAIRSLKHMPEADDDPLQQEWCCLTCFHKFAFGKVRMGGGTGPDIPGNDCRINCPSCRSVNIHPADKTSHEVTHG